SWENNKNENRPRTPQPNTDARWCRGNARPRFYTSPIDWVLCTHLIFGRISPLLLLVPKPGHRLAISTFLASMGHHSFLGIVFRLDPCRFAHRSPIWRFWQILH